MLPKVPSTGAIATTVSVIFVTAAFQFKVLLCVAVITTLPPSSKVRIFPESEAIKGSPVAKDHKPSEVDVGGTSLKVPCVIETD